jgi:hypothetical protein
MLIESEESRKKDKIELNNNIAHLIKQQKEHVTSRISSNNESLGHCLIETFSTFVPAYQIPNLVNTFTKNFAKHGLADLKYASLTQDTTGQTYTTLVPINQTQLTTHNFSNNNNNSNSNNFINNKTS